MKILFSLILTLCAVSGFAEEKAPRQKIPVPKPFLLCATDADCGMTQELCGCCKFIAMNLRSIKKYDALERYCKTQPRACDCEEPVKTAKCVNKLCELVPKK